MKHSYQPIKYGSLQTEMEHSDHEFGFLDDDTEKETKYTQPIKRKMTYITYLTPIIVIILIISIFIAYSSIKSSSSIHPTTTSNIPTSIPQNDENNERSINSNQKPNFIVFFADDLAWNSMGTTTESLTYVTPTLTSLAQQGIFMANFYAQEVCTPSRASLLTGRYPLSVGMQYGMVAAIAEWGMSLDETTLAEVLRDENYATHLLGKWHLGYYSPEYLPTARGFDSFTGFLNGENFYWSKKSPDYDEYTDFLTSDKYCYGSYNGDDMTDYSTTFYTNKALNILDSHPNDKSLFLLMSYQAVHDPFVDVDNSIIGISEDLFPSDVLQSLSTEPGGFRRREYLKSLYQLDQSVKVITERLQENGMMDNTYVIFISDNGGCVFGGGKNGPYRGSKGALFEGGVKVNSFIYSPLLKLQTTDTKYTGLMHISDWFPTILNLADINYDPRSGYSLDGVSHVDAWNTIKDEDVVSPRSHMLYNMYIALTDFNFDIWKDGSFAIRDDRYKLMHTYDDKIYGATYSPSGSFPLDDNIDDLETRCAQQFVTGTFKVSLPLITRQIFTGSCYISLHDQNLFTKC